MTHFLNSKRTIIISENYFSLWRLIFTLWIKIFMKFTQDSFNQSKLTKELNYILTTKLRHLVMVRFIIWDKHTKWPRTTSPQFKR